MPSDPSSRQRAGKRIAVLAEYQRWRRLNTDIQSDLAIYGGKLPQQQLAAKPALKGQRATMLKAMAAATFSLFEVIDLHPAAGLRLRDLSDDHEVWLMDMGLELSTPKGIMLATRVIKPADFAMTTGVSVTMTDAVWKAVEKTFGGTRTDILRDADRDQLAEAVYRAGVKAKAVLRSNCPIIPDCCRYTSSPGYA